MDPSPNPEHVPATDPAARQAADQRHAALAVGARRLPNLFLRSAVTLFLLYGMLTLVLITVVQLDYLTPGIAVAIGVAVTASSSCSARGSWIACSDSSTRWTGWSQSLPPHLRSFVAKVCEKHRFRFPSFGIIRDGAPQAFTYGHHPGNARVVISRGCSTCSSRKKWRRWLLTNLATSATGTWYS